MEYILIYIMAAVAFVLLMMLRGARRAANTAKFNENSAKDARAIAVNEAKVSRDELASSLRQMRIDKPFTELGRRRQVSLDKAEAKRIANRPVKAAPKKK